MAKSKNGGTRAYIRGRIGSDVYSVGKNGKGARQQVVRSLAEQVSNPRTSSQMFGRMVMSTVMQAVSALKPIIDHSFDGLPVGQPSISEFIRRNYALIKADAIAHPASYNEFGLVKYQEKGVKPGAFVLSVGDVILPGAVQPASSEVQIVLGATNLTVGGLKSVLGISGDEYITIVGLSGSAGAKFSRLKINSTLPDSTAISSATVSTLFTQEGNTTLTAALSGNTIELSFASAFDVESTGVIVSKKENGAWVHNTSKMISFGGITSNADTALPTYPTGTEQFLNGGDL